MVFVSPPLLLDGGGAGVGLLGVGSGWWMILGFLSFLAVIMCAFLLDDECDDATATFLSFTQPVKHNASRGKSQ